MKSRTLAAVTDERLTELSGLTASIRFPGWLYAHNDSGDTARVFMIEAKSGRVGAVLTLPVKAIDFEGIGAGLSTAGDPVVYVADVGDNGGKRPYVTVWQFAEPRVIADGHLTVRKEIRIQYEGGPRDCEGIAVDRSKRGGRFWLIEKKISDTKKGGVFACPYDSHFEGPLARRIGEARPWATDAAISPDGKLFIVRAGDKATICRRADFGGAVDFTLKHQVQGEAITFTDNRTLVIGSEGEGQDLIEVTEFPLPKAA